MYKNYPCPICSNKATKILNVLNPTPPEDSFTENKNNLQTIPLDTYCCNFCGLVFLNTQLDPNLSYSEYLYNSSTTIGLQTHFSKRACNLIDKYKIRKQERILDLGCNDGSFLLSFKEIGFSDIQGVEPAPKPYLITKKYGLKVDNNFFNKEWVDKNIDLKPKLITANYMFANIPNPIEFMKQCSRIMSEDSVLSVETGYHPMQFSKNMIDYIYHEHFFYFTIKSLKIMAEICKLDLISVRQNEHKGGSVEVDFVHKSSKINKSFYLRDLYINQESQIIEKYLSYFNKLDREVSENIFKIKKYLKEFINKGGEVIAFGASHSTTTLLYLFDFKDMPIKFIVDDNLIKHDRFSPGLNIPVVSPSFAKVNIEKSKKRLVICLAWQHSRSILKRHQGNLSENCWLIPFPEISLIFPV